MKHGRGRERGVRKRKFCGNRLRENVPSFLPSFRSTRKSSISAFVQRENSSLSPPTLNPIFVQEYRLELARGRRISDDLPIFRPLSLSLSLSADKPAALSRPAISALTTRIFSNSFQTRRESLVAVESRSSNDATRDAIYRARALLDKRGRKGFVFACTRKSPRFSSDLSHPSIHLSIHLSIAAAISSV